MPAGVFPFLNHMGYGNLRIFPAVILYIFLRIFWDIFLYNAPGAVGCLLLIHSYAYLISFSVSAILFPCNYIPFRAALSTSCQRKSRHRCRIPAFPAVLYIFLNVSAVLIPEEE